MKSKSHKLLDRWQRNIEVVTVPIVVVNKIVNLELKDRNDLIKLDDFVRNANFLNGETAYRFSIKAIHALQLYVMNQDIEQHYIHVDIHNTVKTDSVTTNEVVTKNTTSWMNVYYFHCIKPDSPREVSQFIYSQGKSIIEITQTLSSLLKLLI